MQRPTSICPPCLADHLWKLGATWSEITHALLINDHISAERNIGLAVLYEEELDEIIEMHEKNPRPEGARYMAYVINKSFEGDSVSIPAELAAGTIFQDVKNGYTAQRVILYLLSRTQTPYMAFNFKQIADEMGLTERTVRDAVKAGVETGALRVEEEGVWALNF